MKKTITIGILILCFQSEVFGTYNFAFSEMTLQPNIVGGYSIRKQENRNSSQKFYITQTKNIATNKTSHIFSVWDGTQWSNLNELILYKGEMQLITWKERIFAWGYTSEFNSVSAPTGKTIRFLEYTSGHWDTLQGGTFPTNEFLNLNAYATNNGLYFSNTDFNHNTCEIFYYDITKQSFKKLANCTFFLGAPVLIRAGKEKLLVSRIDSFNNQNNTTYITINGEKITTNKSPVISYQYYFSIDPTTDRIFSFWYGWGNKDVSAIELDDSIVNYRNTANIKSYYTLKIFKGTYILQDEQLFTNSYQTLFQGENRWGKLRTNDYGYFNTTALDVALQGMFFVDLSTNKVIKVFPGAKISGTTFIDINNNCSFDKGIDSVLKHIPITFKHKLFSQQTQTDNFGNYLFFSGLGETTIHGPVKSPSCFNPIITISNINDSYNLNLPITKPINHKVKTKLFAPPSLRLFSNSSAKLSIENQGQFCDSISILIEIDPRLQFTKQSDVSIKRISGNKAYATIKNLDYFETRDIVFEFSTDSNVLSTQDIVYLKAIATNHSMDFDTTDNSDIVWRHIVYSRDPNYITVNKTTIPKLTVSELEYEIHFQNEGSDDAIDISIQDNLLPNLNVINGIEVTYSTHPYASQLVKNTLTFNFKNIHLKPKDTNEILSMGFIRFKIQSANNLIEGDSIINKASIYFDLNDAVITNSAVVRVSFDNNISSLSEEQKMTTVYPNPCTSVLTINKSNQSSIEIYDSNGKLYYKSQDQNHDIQLNIEQWNSGIYFIKSGNELFKFIKL